MTTKRTLFVLSVLFAISFVGLGRDLWTPDEPREAEISREMMLAPRVVPSLNDHDFVEKPPLYYWTVAGVFALRGEPSAAAARAVSGAASFLTLLLVFLWGRRDFSAGVGIAAAIGLATCAQFMIPAHWVLMDPLLMLFTTAALWASSSLVRGVGTRTTLFVFYGALTLALWTKGLVGPVLVGAGLLAYAASERSLAPLKRHRPFIGIAVLLLATGAIATLIGVQSGAEDVREWLWVNHVQRFFDPTDATGHDQPFYYYLWAIPVAVFPWWVPFALSLRPSAWHRGAPDGDARRAKKMYLGALTLGMALLLSASATKRGNYLLPLLPPLLLLLAAMAAEAWARRQPGPIRGWLWWAQIACVLMFAAGPVALALAYLRTADPAGIAFLTVVVGLTVGLLMYSRRGDRTKALAALAACALATVVGLFAVVARLAAPQKDMTPFVAWVGEQTPPGDPIYVFGDIDETLSGIVPFVTGRDVVPLASAEIDALRPRYVLAQGKFGSAAMPTPGAPYELLSTRVVGLDRRLALWRRANDALPGDPSGGPRAED